MSANATSAYGPTPSLVRRLLPGLAVLVVLPLCAAAVLLWQQHYARMDDLIAEDADEMHTDLEMILNLQASGLASAIQPIAADPAVHKALGEGDAAGLLATWQPVFASLQHENHVSHLYFLNPDRTCLLRVHAPGMRGDRIDRFTAREAERTRKTASGLELGPLGTLTLRVVQPVIVHDKLLGYVELGKEVEDALIKLRQHMETWNQMAVIVHKDLLDRSAWEASQRQFGREADWGRMPHHVVIIASQNRLPDAFAAWVDPATPGSEPHTGNAEVLSDGKRWRIMAMPLRDASGAEIGNLLAMRDISAERAGLVRLLVLGGSAGLLLLGVVLVVVHRLLARADLRIGLQQSSLRNERWRLGSIIEATRAGTWEWDIATGTVVVSERWAQILGYTCLDLGALNRARWERLFHPDDLPAAKALLARHFAGELPFLDHECRLKHRDGRWVWIHCRGRVFTRSDAGEPLLMFGTHSDITPRKDGEAERERLMQRQQASELAEMMHSNRLVALGTVMAGLAHEFNHPAQVVLLNQRSLRAMVEACVEVARDRPGDAVGLLSWSEVAALAPSLLDDMESATTYLQELIENVRSYAGPNDDGCEVMDSAVLTAVCVASLRLVASYARRRQVALSSRLIGAATAGATSGCSRLQQVVVNLLINAIQASQPGGTVSLELEQPGGTDRLTICDEGAGIDPQVLDRLGRAFVTTKAATGGSGLGLFISHHLVSELGGTLALASRQPHGTTATVEFTRPGPP